MILEDRHILNLLREPRYTEAFPVLATVAEKLKLQTNPEKRGCGACNRRQNGDVINEAKQLIAGFNEENHKKFREMMNAEKIQFTYSSNKQRVRITF